MDLKEATNRISAQAELVTKIREEVAKVIVGQEKLIDRLILAMVTGGHILLEGVPGLAKTLSVNTLAKALGLDFKHDMYYLLTAPCEISFSRGRSRYTVKAVDEDDGLAIEFGGKWFRSREDFFAKASIGSKKLIAISDELYDFEVK